MDVHYQNARLRADHVEYDSENQVVTASGHVQLDYMTQHIEADDARYELRTGHGTFHHVHGFFALQRRPEPTLLISPNPLYFDAEEADRLDDNTYRIRKAWLTVCDPGRPSGSSTRRRPRSGCRSRCISRTGTSAYFPSPSSTCPTPRSPPNNTARSGFMIPELGKHLAKGLRPGRCVLLGAARLDGHDASVPTITRKRGWSQRAELRMRPWENAQFEASYFGVIDRGIEQVNAPPIKQGGHETKLLFTSLLPGGWRAVADLDQLTSLTFRLAWFETFTQAVNSEVRNTAFLTNNFRGFSLNFAALSYQNYLSATSADFDHAANSSGSAIQLGGPAVLQPLAGLFFLRCVHRRGASHRGVTPFETPGFVERSELAPSVTMPLHFGDWLDVTPSFTFRSTYYGGQLQNGAFVLEGLFRNTEEFSLDIRLPVFERVWGDGDTKWKHVIEPDVVYRYVTGVNDFGRFVRFDEDETLTDTNEVEYGITQRLFRRTEFGRQRGIRHLAAGAEIFLRSHVRRRARSRSAERFSNARRAHAFRLRGHAAALFADRQRPDESSRGSVSTRNSSSTTIRCATG